MLSQRVFYLLLVLEWISETFSGFILGTSSAPDNKTSLTCFRSSVPGAERATQLHGELDSKGLLWNRDPETTDPLPHCSSSSFSPPPSLCEVCLLDENVYIICDNLPAQPLYLERPPASFSSKQSGCPRLPPAGATSVAPSATTGATGRNNDRGRTGLFIFLVFFIIVLLLLLILLLLIWSVSKQAPGEEPNNVSYDPGSDYVRINVAENVQAGRSVG